MFKYQAKQFCLNTGLHGYRFIVLPKRILLERVIWCIVVIVALIAAISLLLIAWGNFQQNPTIVVTDSTHHPIWNYPFPGVTICSYNIISKLKAIEFAKTLSVNSSTSFDEILEDLKLLRELVVHNHADDIPQERFAGLQTILNRNKLSVYTILRDISTPCNETVQRCKWKGEERRCDNLFLQIPTAEGFCCAFNQYALVNYSFPGAIARKIPKKPRRVSACGYITALEVLINTDPDDYYASKLSSIGNKVLIHNPYHIADWNSQTILVERGIISLVGITPERTYSTENIISMAPNQRKCSFPYEYKQPTNFVQNFHNCMARCRTDLAVKLCNCLPFYYHNPYGDYPKIRICNLTDIKCLNNNKNSILSSHPELNFNSPSPDEDRDNLCGCVDDCDYLQYVAEGSSGALTRKYSNNQLNLYGGVTLKHQSVIRVYFNDLVATKNRRDVTFSWHTLLAYYGGLLGLFIGFSFVSAVELVYFFTIRLISDSNTSDDTGNKQKAILVRPPPRYREVFDEIDQFKLRRRNSPNCTQYSGGN